MQVDRLYTRNALSIRSAAALSEAAATMRRFRVGVLLVIDDRDGHLVPVGIVTDRDLALSGFASEATTVADAMTPVIASVHDTADSHEALELMRAHGVRRLAVTDRAGAIIGVLSIDDVLNGIAADLTAASAVLQGELRLDAAV